MKENDVRKGRQGLLGNSSPDQSVRGRRWSGFELCFHFVKRSVSPKKSPKKGAKKQQELSSQSSSSSVSPEDGRRRRPREARRGPRVRSGDNVEVGEKEEKEEEISNGKYEDDDNNVRSSDDVSLNMWNGIMFFVGLDICHNFVMHFCFTELQPKLLSTKMISMMFDFENWWVVQLNYYNFSVEESAYKCNDSS